METTYCVKEQRFTGCTEPSGYAIAANGRTYFWCTCISCKKMKSRWVSGNSIHPTTGSKN